MKKILISSALTLTSIVALCQGTAFNTTGANPAATNMVEITQSSTAANMVALYAIHNGATVGTGYGFQAIKTGASTTNVAGYFSASGGTNNYAIIVPSGSGNVGIGLTSPSSALLHVQQAGSTLTAGYFQITNAANNQNAMWCLTNGGGEAVSGQNTGTGQAARFQIIGVGNTSDALSGLSDGSGDAVDGYNDGTGRAGSFRTVNTANTSDAVFISSNGNSTKALNVTHTGATAGSTDYGIYSSVSGGGINNIGGYFTASGATNNYALRLGGSTSGTLDLSPAAATTAYSMILPATIGTTNQVLSISSVGGSTATLGWAAMAGANNWVNAGAGSVIDANSIFPGVQIRNNTPSFYTANLQITYNATSSAAGDVLGSVTYGDNQGTAAQAGVFAHRDAVSSSGADLPTRLVFYTIPDASSTLTERMRIDNAGSLLINTTASGPHKISVVGTAGLSTGTSWINTSDIRLKDIRGDYEYGLKEVIQLHTVRFNYKKDNPLGLPSDVAMTGFIAQEVQKLIPDAVKTRPDGYLELNVDPIHWAAINAIRELNQKTESQQQEITNYKLQIEKLLGENLVLKASSDKQQIVNAELKSDVEKIKSYLTPISIGVKAQK